MKSHDRQRLEERHGIENFLRLWMLRFIVYSFLFYLSLSAPHFSVLMNSKKAI